MHHEYNFNTDIRIYNNIAFATSVVQTVCPNTNRYFLCRLFHIQWRFKWKAPVFSLYHAYRWDCFEKKIHCALNKKRLHQIIKDQLEQGYDIYVAVNERHIPNRSFYQQKRFIHDLNIYGYDDKTRQYDTAGYNDRNKYEKQTVTYEDLWKAVFTNMPINYFYSFKLKNNYDFAFKENCKIEHNIEKYINNKCKWKDINLTNFIRKLLLNRRKRYLVDIRTFRILMEHKKILTELDRYGYGDCGFEELYRKSVLLFYLAIRWYVLNDESKLDNITDKLAEIDAIERKCFERLLGGMYEADAAHMEV